MTRASDEYRKQKKTEKWQAEQRDAVLETSLKAHHDGTLPPPHRAWNNPARWREKPNLAASMDRLRAYEEAKGQPLPEGKP